jgi:hypothetical protein
MSVSLNRLSTTIVAVAVIAAALGLGSALGATPPTGMSAQEYKALVIRSQALNDLYGEPEVTSQYKALVIRSQALNDLYGEPEVTSQYKALVIRSQALNDLYGEPEVTSQYKALVIRSQALNDLYGEPEVTSQYKAMVRADRIRGEAMNRLAKSGVLTAPPVPSETVAGDGFDWTDFAIGLGAMFGFVLLAGALAGATLYARRGHARAHAA